MSGKIDEIQIKDCIKNLQDLGFSDKESRVYIALLSLGEVGASKVVTETGLHGQFVYDALNKLEDKNLVNHSIIRGRKKFVAQNPEKLVSFIDQKRQKAIEASASLNSLLTIPKNNQFEVYQGNESFIAHELKTVKEQESNSEMLIIGGTGDVYENTLGKSFQEYDFLRAKKNIKARYIGSEEQRQSLHDRARDRKNFHIRLLPGAFTGQVNMTIYSNKISFYMFGEPVVIFSLQNKKLADSYRQFFETLWKLGK